MVLLLAAVLLPLELAALDGLPFASAAGAAEPVIELGANGDGPTVLIGFGAGVGADGAGDDVVWLFAGDDVRPRVDGRGMWRDFWYRPRGDTMTKMGEKSG